VTSFAKTVEFYKVDFSRTLFPLETNKVLIETSAAELGDFVYAKITHGKDSAFAFLPQTKAYAAKAHHHLRRTAKLDPVAEFFLYDLIYRNRRAFPKGPKTRRINFGYRFEGGQPVSPVQAFRAFKAEVQRSLNQYKYCAKFDVSCYFNSLYHHDLVAWFNDAATSDEDAVFFDKFLKQTNSGRSIDCLVHGIYPAKMIGSQFLTFIERASWLSCQLTLRFMDDFYLFSNDLNEVLSDFNEIQRLLGEKGLSVNPFKTEIGEIESLDIEKKVDDIKKGLLDRRRAVITGSGGDVEEHQHEGGALEKEEVEYLMDLLKNPELEDTDAELVLTLMRNYGEDVLSYLPAFLERFANLSKNIYYFCGHIEDKTALAEVVDEYLEDQKHVTEYQLFWLAKILESYLLESKDAGGILSAIYDHPNATDISRAKVLEIRDRRYGLSDLREEHLRTGASGWLAWSAASGVRIEKRKNRNHLLSYFANGSPINELIATCIQKLP
jgi:hypothetical protein